LEYITIDANEVRSLITSASNYNIQYLELSLGAPNVKLVLPHSLSAFESLNELHLGLKFTLNIPSDIHFPSLKKLVVSDVTFANENSVQLFSGCPVLQELDQCWNLHIKEVDDQCRLWSFEIDVVNLLSLSCTCSPTVEFILVNLTSLVDAYIDIDHVYPHGEPYAAQSAIELLRGLSSTLKSLRLYNNTLELMRMLCVSYNFTSNCSNLILVALKA